VPKQTFWNLPEAKRETLVRTALEEFAAHDYARASVSRVASRAGIAKGSLYQYFDDKQDLFLYLLDRAQRTLLETVGGGRGTPAPGGADPGFFAVLRAQMAATVQAAAAHPLEAALLQRSYAGTVPFHDEILERGRTLRQDYLSQMVTRAKARGELSAHLDADVATMVLESVVARIGPFLLERLTTKDASAAEDGTTAFDRPEVEAVFEHVVGILEHGMGPTDR
jgi:TetR/AcrR family transcriptional regulator